MGSANNYKELKELVGNPNNYKELKELAFRLAEDPLTPDSLKGKPADIILKIYAGAEIGLDPAESLRTESLLDRLPAPGFDAPAGIPLVGYAAEKAPPLNGCGDVEYLRFSYERSAQGPRPVRQTKVDLERFWEVEQRMSETRNRIGKALCVYPDSNSSVAFDYAPVSTAIAAQNVEHRRIEKDFRTLSIFPICLFLVSLHGWTVAGTALSNFAPLFFLTLFVGMFFGPMLYEAATVSSPQYLRPTRIDFWAKLRVDKMMSLAYGFDEAVAEWDRGLLEQAERDAFEERDSREEAERAIAAWNARIRAEKIAAQKALEAEAEKARLRAEELQKALGGKTLKQLDKMKGVQFEQWLMEVLGARGWTVADTPTSGDFGADLIAEKDGKRISIQAKRYSKPVGNKAVNEALGGRDFYKCNATAVITQSSFTKACRKQAKASGTVLIGRDQLGDMDRLLAA